MTASYLRAATPGEVWAYVTTLRARTLVVDVEPLVAFWDTDLGVLEDGIAAVLASIAGAGADWVVFATNSARRPSTPPTTTWANVRYLASARKPLQMTEYKHLPRPGLLVGDQVATDGVLARRLGYVFLHYTPRLPGVPLGPRLMRQIGRPIRPLLFRT